MGASEVVEDGEGEEKAAARRGGTPGRDGACCAVGDEGHAAENGKTVVVGVRMDAQSRELLTWVLVKVAEAGDRVVALHVLYSSADSAADCSDPGRNSTACSPLNSLVQAFDSVLAVYEGFCNLKQIDLKLSICRGSSLREVLVREVKRVSATSLILGVSKNNRAIGSSTSIVKYCAKKLPRECAVVAVSNGKIVSQRDASPSVLRLPSSEQFKAKGRKQPPETLSEVQPTPISEITDGEDATWRSPPVRRGMTFKSDEKFIGSFCDDLEMPEICSSIDDGSLSSEEAASSSNRPACASGFESNQLNDEESIGMADATQDIVDVPNSHYNPVEGVSIQGTGWPILRGTIIYPKRNDLERPKAEVLVSAAVHPDRKPSKFEPKAFVNINGHNGAIVPVKTDPSLVSNAVCQEEHDILPKELKSLRLKYSSTCRLFSYSELMSATSNFSSDNLVGKGGNSGVYKGCLPDGKELAVKILKKSEDALEEFLSEVEILSALRHKNIISLPGFCFEKENLILVYEFLSRGSLEDNLHGNEDEKRMVGWSERFKVAICVAEALDYLHGAGNAQPVIHRDVKSSNILFGDDYEAQLSDFGLAKWASSSSSHTAYDDVVGTFGYLAPEYFTSGKVNEKIDVYAFGVVLLELLTGRKPISTECSKGEQSLVMWAKPLLRTGKVARLLDPCFGDQHDPDQVERMALAASLCIRRAPRSRPTMALVLKLLQGDEDITKWARLQSDAPEDHVEPDGSDARPGAVSIQSHLSLALLGVEDDSLSVSSTEHSVDYILAHGSLEDYLRRRCSRSSSFD